MIPSIGIVLLCRMSSTRLPGKMLRQVNGRTVLGRILDRVRDGAGDLPVVVATSTHETDDPIEQAANREGATVFRGSLDDVSARFLSAAQAQKWDYAIRLNGDNLWADIETLNSVAALARCGKFDFITNVPERAFPIGMSVECLRTSFYALHLPSMPQTDREHVTSWFYKNHDVGERYIFPNTICPEAAGLDLALDTEEDLERLTKICDLAEHNSNALGLRDIYRLATETAVQTPWEGDSGPLLVAEIGGNHEGNFEVAKAMTQQAIDAGADCVKFQIYQGSTLVSKVESPDRHKHFQKFELDPAQHIELAEMCRAANVKYSASVWDLASLDWIDEYLDFYKIGSGDLTAWPILAEFARRGKPILLSTGLADMNEVLQTVRYIQSINEVYTRPEYLCLLQCTSMYPIPDKDSHLRVMDALRSATGLSVGYSDHTIGSEALKAATAMGAEVLEFHFTDTREGKEFRDHKVSLVGVEVSALRQDLKQICALRGRPVKVPQSSELANGHEISFRRAAYAARDIEKGEVISEADLIYLRPLHGVDARDAHLIIGSTAQRSIPVLRAIKVGEDIS